MRLRFFWLFALCLFVCAQAQTNSTLTKREKHCTREKLVACVGVFTGLCAKSYPDATYYCAGGVAAGCGVIFCQDEPSVRLALQIAANKVIDWCTSGTTSPSQTWGYNTRMEAVYNAMFNYVRNHQRDAEQGAINAMAMTKGVNTNSTDLDLASEAVDKVMTGKHDKRQQITCCGRYNFLDNACCEYTYGRKCFPNKGGK